MVPEQDSLHTGGTTEGDDFLLFDLSPLPEDELAHLQKSMEDLGAVLINNQELVGPILKQLGAIYDEKARRQGL